MIGQLIINFLWICVHLLILPIVFFILFELGLQLTCLIVFAATKCDLQHIITCKLFSYILAFSEPQVGKLSTPPSDPQDDLVSSLFAFEHPSAASHSERFGRSKRRSRSISMSDLFTLVTESIADSQPSEQSSAIEEMVIEEILADSQPSEQSAAIEEIHADDLPSYDESLEPIYDVLPPSYATFSALLKKRRKNKRRRYRHRAAYAPDLESLYPHDLFLAPRLNITSQQRAKLFADLADSNAIRAKKKFT